MMRHTSSPVPSLAESWKQEEPACRTTYALHKPAPSRACVRAPERSQRLLARRFGAALAAIKVAARFAATAASARSVGAMPRTRRTAAAALGAALAAAAVGSGTTSQADVTPSRRLLGNGNQLPGECNGLMTESYSTTFANASDGFWVQTGSYLYVPNAPSCPSVRELRLSREHARPALQSASPSARPSTSRAQGGCALAAPLCSAAAAHGSRNACTAAASGGCNRARAVRDLGPRVRRASHVTAC
jgi:hypothetical protein